jgi:hypothetical protein
MLSCERQLDFELEEYERKLVVNSIVAPGRPMVFYLSESSQTLEVPTYRSGIYTGRLIVTEDSAVIYNAVTAIDSGFLYTNLVPKPGSFYEVFFDIPNFPLARSFDLVPTLLPELQLIEVINLGDKYQIILSINDHLVKERYELQCFVRGKEAQAGDTVWVTKQVSFNSNDKVFLTNINSFRGSNTFSLFNDDLFSSSSTEIRINVNKNAFNSGGFDAKSFIVELGSLSETYFNYILEIIENNHVYGGPLASASYKAGNVEGGFGIFGAYTFVQDTISIQ